MKNTTKIFSLVVLLLFTTNAFSQSSRFGVKAGLNMSNMTLENSDDSNLKFGLHAGVFNKIAITDRFAIQPELLYSSKGLKNEYDNVGADGEVKFNLNYIDLPVKLVFNLAEDFTFQFGPYVGYLVNANVDTDAEVLGFFDVDSQDNLDRDKFNALDFGLTGGLGFDFDPLVVGFNYNLGLSQVAKDGEATAVMLGDARNTVIQIYAGILF